MLRGSMSASAPSSPAHPRVSPAVSGFSSGGSASQAFRPPQDPPPYQSYQSGGYGSPSASRESPRTPRQNPREVTGAPLSPSPLASESRHRPVQEYHSALFTAGSDFPHPSDGPTASAPSFTTAVSAPHRRQQSVPSLLPLALINRATSPERRQQQQQQQQQNKLPPPLQRRQTSAEMPPYTGDGRRGGGSQRGGLAGWFTGNLRADEGSPRPHTRPTTSIKTTTTTSTPDTTPTRKTTAAGAAGTSSESSSPSSSRFAFLASGMSAISAALSQSPISPTRSPADETEDLLRLDVEAALYPSSGGVPPSDRETFSPSAFKNLQLSSASLARRLQATLQRAAGEARSLAAERDAQRDELDEAETRSAHLKMQLEGMAARAARQEGEMRLLAEELAAERRKMAKLLAWAQSGGGSGSGSPSTGIVVSGAGAVPATLPPHVVMASEGSTVSEDLGVDEEERQRRRRLQRWRGSGGTVKSADSVALSFDTEEDYDEEEEEEEEDRSSSSLGEGESVFSRSRSPTIAPAAAGGGGAFDGGPVVVGPSCAPGPAPPQHLKVTALRPRLSQQQHQQPMSAFQKLVKNVTGAGRTDEDSYTGPGCRNCKGQAASVAWDTVSLLRDENKGLKHRVGELEVAVEGALDLVNGVGL